MSVCAGIVTIAGRTYAASGASSAQQTIAADRDRAAVGSAPCRARPACVPSAIDVISGPTSVPVSSGLPTGRRGVRGRHALDDLVDARTMHDGATQRRAALAGGAGSSERHAANHELDVGRWRDDGRVVAAELEDAATESGGDHDRRPAGPFGSSRWR